MPGVHGPTEASGQIGPASVQIGPPSFAVVKSSLQVRVTVETPTHNAVIDTSGNTDLMNLDIWYLPDLPTKRCTA
jgi:hypothetical protein